MIQGSKLILGPMTCVPKFCFLLECSGLAFDSQRESSLQLGIVSSPLEQELLHFPHAQEIVMQPLLDPLFPHQKQRHPEATDRGRPTTLNKSNTENTRRQSSRETCSRVQKRTMVT